MFDAFSEYNILKMMSCMLWNACDLSVKIECLANQLFCIAPLDAP